MAKKNIDEYLMQTIGHSMATGVDVQNRTLYLIGEIDDTTSRNFIIAFSLLDQVDGPITIVLVSPGGDEDSGYAIFDIIRTAKNNVIMKGFGSVHSIAAIIFQAGDEKYLSPLSSMMIHNGSVDMGSTMEVDKIIVAGKIFQENNLKYQKILSEFSGNSIETIAKWCTEEKYFTANEAVEKGFADGLIDYEPK